MTPIHALGTNVRYLHISIDGSWLRKLCAPGGVFAAKMEDPNEGVRLDFTRINQMLLTHIKRFDKYVRLGELVLATSVFSLQDDFDAYPAQHGFAVSQVEQVKRDVYSRNKFVESAVEAGYKDDINYIYRPEMKPWILEQCVAKNYREKRVDTAFVAHFASTAASRPQDYHCVITGDADVLPALHIVYPTFTRNVFIATTNADESGSDSYSSSYALSTHKFDIPTLYLQNHVAEIIQGDHVYTCTHCKKLFVRSSNNPVPLYKQPCCSACYHRKHLRKAA